MSELVDLFYNFVMEGLVRYGFVVWMLAILGLVSIVSVIGNKAFSALKYIFMIFIAIPSILVVGLINKSNRKERLKELGEIKSHLKQNPISVGRIQKTVVCLKCKHRQRFSEN